MFIVFVIMQVIAESTRAALNLQYPAGKLNVYVLDDGGQQGTVIFIFEAK